MTVQDVVRELLQYRDRKKLTTAALAGMLGVPRGTLSHWLAPEGSRGKTLPSPAVVSRILSFLQEKTASKGTTRPSKQQQRTGSGDAEARVHDAVRRLEQYRIEHKLTKAALAKLMGIPRNTLGPWLVPPNAPSFGPPSPQRLVLIEKFLGDTAAMPRTRASAEAPRENALALKSALRVKAELSLLLMDLEFFRDATPEERDILKKTVPGPEWGRISGLMASMYDENELAAWKAFSENTRGTGK